MPATVGVPWHRADHKQHSDDDKYSYPHLPSSHGLTSVLTRLFPCNTPPDVYCTHDYPRVTTPEAHQKSDWCPKLGALARVDPRTSSIRAREDFAVLMSIPAGVDLHQRSLEEGEEIHEP
jgi:hypothetical protein